MRAEQPTDIGLRHQRASEPFGVSICLRCPCAGAGSQERGLGVNESGCTKGVPMRLALTSTLVFGMLTSAALAADPAEVSSPAPVQLTEAQLDAVTAGQPFLV